jgi:hypothetical protein
MKRIIPFFIFSIFFTATVFSQTEEKKNIPGATMYFSDKPFTNSNEGKKTSFTSGNFIYGRLELNDKTLGDAFSLPKDGEAPLGNKNDCYLRYRVTVYKNGEQQGQPNFWDFLYVFGKEKNSNAFNFDILPEPSAARSMLCGTENFSSNIAAGPLYHIISQDRFPDNGAYTIRVNLFSRSTDAWGKLADAEKWPVMEEDFTFNFNGNDIKKIKANGEAANGMVMTNALKLDKMPDWFYKAGKASDPKVSNAALAAIFKRDIPAKGVTKIVIGEYTGPLWVVEKDGYGIIQRRSLVPYVNIVYKLDGKCHVGTVSLYEPYEGNGKYGALTVGNQSSDNRQDYWLDCSLVK